MRSSPGPAHTSSGPRPTQNDLPACPERAEDTDLDLSSGVDTPTGASSRCCGWLWESAASWLQANGGPRALRQLTCPDLPDPWREERATLVPRHPSTGGPARRRR
jgi:hypothetical protein